MRKTLRGRPDYLGLEKKLGESPLDYLMLNFPFKCNYRCIKCCNDGYRQPKQVSGQQFLNAQEMKKIIDEAKELGARVVVIAGEGEPMLDKTSNEIVAYIHSKGMIPIIFTTANLIDRKEGEFLRDNGATLIISLDSLVEETYEYLNGRKGSFKKSIENIAMLRELYSRTEIVVGDYLIVRLAINALVSRHNEGEISAIRNYCSDDMLFVCNFPSPHGAILQRWKEFVGTEVDYKRLKDISARMSETTGHSTMTEDKKCAYQHYGITVGSDGSYLTCAYNQPMSGIVMEARTLSLKDALRQIRKLEAEFSAQYGQQPCLMRHESFEQFLSMAKVS